MSRGRDQNPGRSDKSRQRSDRQGHPNSQRRHARQRSDDRVRAQELVEKSGLPWNLALQVARNQVELNVVLERLARRDKVEMLVRRHGLERSMAHQVVLGNQTLEEILLRDRMKNHISENHDRSVLADHLDSGAPLSLALHGVQEDTGTISSIDQYEFTFVPLEGEARTIHKLQAKFAFDPANSKVIRNNVQRDPSAETSEPIAKPQDRYHHSNRRLFQLVHDETVVTVQTLEGDILRGTLTWVARWELGLLLKGNTPVVLFRHALSRVEGS